MVVVAAGPVLQGALRRSGLARRADRAAVVQRWVAKAVCPVLLPPLSSSRKPGLVNCRNTTIHMAIVLFVLFLIIINL